MAGRRLQGDGAVYKTADGWRGSVDLGIDPATGKRRRKYVRGQTKAITSARVRDALNARDAGTLRLGADPTFREWLDFYIADIAPTRKRPPKRRTLQGYQSLVRTWLPEDIGKVRLSKLREEHLEAVYSRMRAAGLTVSPTRMHAVFSVALGAAHKRGRITRNPAALAETPARDAEDDTPEVPTYTTAEARKILTTAAEYRCSARWWLAFGLALRQGEALGITWDQVDLDTGTLRISRQITRDRAEHGCGTPTPGKVVRHRRQPDGTVKTVRETVDVHPCGKRQPARCPLAVGGGLVLRGVKTKASRAVIPLPVELVDALKARATEQKRERIRAGSEWAPFQWAGQTADLVFTTPTGGAIDPRADWDTWGELVQAAGVRYLNPHQARHSAATALVAMGVHPRVAQAILRHASSVITQDVYSEAEDAEVRAAVSKLSGRLFGQAGSAGA